MLIDDLKKTIREVPDFPKPGINFYDVSTLFRNPEAFRATVDRMVERYRGERLDALAGIEARGFILGGALGNLVDRIRYGEVVDFLHFRLWQGYSWPDFNFADSFIVVGVALLLLELFATEGEQSTPPPPS